MKKLISCLSLLLFPLLVGAQDFGVWEQIHYANKKDPFSAVYRKIVQARAANQKLPWVKIVKDQLSAAQPHGWLGANNWDHIAALPDGRVSYTNARTYEQRTQAWQKALRANPVLRHFNVSTPDAKPVTAMPQEHADYITAFLQAPIMQDKQDKRFVPVDVEAYKHFIVRVTLKPSKDAWPVHLIFNCFSKQMYVSYPWFEVPGVKFEKLK